MKIAFKSTIETAFKLAKKLTIWSFIGPASDSYHVPGVYRHRIVDGVQIPLVIRDHFKNHHIYTFKPPLGPI